MTATANVNGTTIAYSEQGSGPPMILLHGGLGSGATWQPVATRLADRFRVITPDSRGHGRSRNPGGALSYSLLADDVAGLITELELDHPVVAGWSDGGQIALELAVRHPQAAAALVIGGAFHDFAGSGLRDIHRKLLAELQAPPAQAAHDDEEVEELKALHDDWPALLEQTAGMWLDYPGLPDAAIRDIVTPVLVLAGDRDQLVRLELSISLFDLLPDAELAVIAHAGHSDPLGEARAAAVAFAIGDFAARRGSPHTPTTSRNDP
jgi:pimeloyl-ACP methyl ester carboxylesterase